MLTVALLGYDGGEIMRRGLADFPVVVRSRLHPAHPGSAGFDLSRHPRIAGGAEPWPSLNFSEPRVVLIPARCATGWSGSASDFVEYDVEADPAARARMRELAGGQRTVPVLVEDGKVVQSRLAGSGLHRRGRSE